VIAIRTKQAPWIALVAAMLMLVQSVAGSFAATATHPKRDAFGNPLCITSTDNGWPAGNPHTLPGCCILGCGASASALAVPPERGGLNVGFETAPLRFAPVFMEFFIASEDHDPGSPRGPPVLV
jgi:hypothetical protein